jgi:hypothetical protein
MIQCKACKVNISGQFPQRKLDDCVIIVKYVYFSPSNDKHYESCRDGKEEVKQKQKRSMLN